MYLKETWSFTGLRVLPTAWCWSWSPESRASWARTAAGKAMWPTPSNGCWESKVPRACAPARCRMFFLRAPTAARRWPSAKSLSFFPIAKKNSALRLTKSKSRRRVERDGGSDYFINSKACRLKDIQQLFRDTGIGRVAYSFLQQGQIDRLFRRIPWIAAPFSKRPRAFRASK